MGALDDITWRSLFDDLWLRARREAIPISGTFELTPLCNFRCRMCYVRLEPDQVPNLGCLHSGDEWLRLAREAVSLGAYGITLTGGEPLMHPDFEKIYRGLLEMGVLVSLLTNGSLINEKHIRLFSEHPLRQVRVTLYGSSNSTYERLCGAPEGFDRVMRSLRLLLDAKIPLSLSYTETTENVGDFDEVMSIAKGLNVPIIVCTDLDKPVRGAHSDAESLRVDPDFRRLPTPDAACINSENNKILEKANSEGLLKGLFSSCRPYRTYFFVNWNGTMENCGSMSFCRSLPFEWGFAAAWDDMQKKLSELVEPRECRACPDKDYCTACPGKRDAEAGRPDAIPKRFCIEACKMHGRYNENVVRKGGE